MEVKCPICGSSLADDQFNLATQRLNEKLAKMNLENADKQLKKFEEEKTELIRKYQTEIHQLEKSREDRFKTIEDELKKSYVAQIQHIQKNYNESLVQHSDQLKVLEHKLKNSFEEQLSNKDNTINELLHEQEDNKKKAVDNAKTSVQQQVDKLQNEILQRDIQLLRFKGEVESLKKQISQTQAELKGEAGELDLYGKLTEAFPEDQFRRQTRGRATGDIVQQIRTKTGIIDIPIVYDNKEADSITTNDIAKAKKYQQIHGTKYVVIVSTRLPKREVKSGLLGDRDGIYLVHPSILLPFVKYLREAIIELSMMSKSERERDSKEVMLYEYIRSQEFTSRIERISRIETQFNQLQDKEEKEHEKMWKDRKGCISQLEHEQMEISLRVQGILSRKEDVEPAVISNQNERKKNPSSS